MTELKILPFYTGKHFISEISSNTKSKNLLWLEILVNDKVEWKNFDVVTDEIYHKACLWYWNFKSLIEFHCTRSPLEKVEGKIDNKDFRKFIEVISFVSNQA